MFVFVAIALVACPAAFGTPATKVLPVYEPATPLPELPSWCAGDCPQHVLDNPVLLVTKDAEASGRFSVASSPPGLNGLVLSNSSLELDKAAALVFFPLERFPFDHFPGLRESEVHIPKHSAKVGALLQDRAAPVIVALAEGDVAPLTEALGLVHAADLALGPQRVSVAKDYGRVARRGRGVGGLVSAAADAEAAGSSHRPKPALSFTQGSVPLVLVQCS